MNTSYYLRNNPVMIMGIIESVLQDEGSTDVGRLAALLPLMMDDKIVDLLINQNMQYTFRQLVLSNNLFLANYNDRYLSLLKPLYHAVSIMLDVGDIELKGSTIITSESTHAPLFEGGQSQRLRKTGIATKRLLKMSQRETISELYHILNIEL